MEIFEIPDLRNPVMIAAFGGWNDAGEAATGAIDHLLSVWPYITIAEIESEDYYDFQVNRPMASVDENDVRHITWPTTRIYGISTPDLDRDLVLIKGIEPSMRWRNFVSEILDVADNLEVSTLVTLGALLADAPHSRPISVSATGANPEISLRLGLDLSKYEGPTGIVGALQDLSHRRGIDAVSLWCEIPHYAPNPPSPKASLSLLNALEDFLSISIPQNLLPELSKQWETTVDQLAREDNEISKYVKQLEESRDATDLPEATGDAIAKEFERFLRRRSNE